MYSFRFHLFALVAIITLWTSGASGVATSFVTSDKTELNILGVFGHPGKSHFDVFSPLLVELARRGHNVTVASHFPRTEADKAKEPLPNYKDVSLRSEKVGVFLNVVDLHNVNHSPIRFFSEMLSIRFMANLACESGLRHPEMMALANSSAKYDVILTENFNTNCFLGVIQKFDAPFVFMSSHQLMVWANEQLGNPQEASYMPVIFHGFPRPLSFFNRMFNALTIGLAWKGFDLWYHSIDQALVNEIYGPGVPDLREIARNASGIMVNTHYSLHGVRPQLPNVIEVGGLHIPKKTKPLPEDIAKFLDEADEGVLYFNLGSMVKAASMPKEKLDMIIKVLAEIPRKVIWKWEAETLPYKLSNILVKKWLPQFDILNHPNVKSYFGHGGLLGLSEGTYAGKPMILLPIFGDQFHNAAAAEARGTAIVLKFHELDEKSLRNALDEIFNNTRYRENAQKLSKAYKDRPASPVETAVWWTENIARGNGLPYIKSEGANLPWYQRHLVDVALFLLAVSLVLFYAIYKTFGLLVSLFRSKTTQGQTNKKKKSKKTD